VSERGAPVVCLGEALVDLVCEQPVARLADAPSFLPRFGGSVANIAVGAARFGARSSVLGGAGTDEWGSWLREVLAREGVDVSRFHLLAGAPTPHAFVAVSDRGEPSYAFFGEGREPAVAALAEGLDEVIDAAEPGVLVLGSDTLNGESERAVTMSARALALERGWLVLYDPNLRPARWPNVEALAEAGRAVIPGAALVKLSGDEALALTDASTPADAARSLVRAGAVAAVVTLGADGMLVATEASPEPAAVPSRPVAAVDATGAGDSVAAVMAAALALTLDPEVVPAVAELAARTARGVVAERGALAGLPSAGRARRELSEAIEGRALPSWR